MKDPYVWIWLPGEDAPTLCGRLFWKDARAQFAYVRSYPQKKKAIPLHPDWPLDESPGTRHGPAEDDALPPVFIDAAPGAWGEYVLRKLLGKSLNAFEYLTHSTADRVGAFEFSEQADAPPQPPAPLPEARVDELRAAIATLDKDKELPIELRMVWRHGTSVGGRWPKASVVDAAGDLWLLKFGSRLQRKELQPRVEALGMALAEACGIEVPRHRLEQSDVQPILWVRRFDRLPAGRRLHMISARSLFELSERAALDRASYPEIAVVLRRLAKSADDAMRWFDRMIVNIVIGNTDDHPLNHLFFWDGNRLSLAPAFDVEPQAGEALHHSMRIGAEGARGTLENALSECGEFGLTAEEAESRISGIVKTVAARWRELANVHGLSTSQVRDVQQSALLLKEAGVARYL